MKRIALIPGDGVGKEVIPAAARVLAAACELTGQKIAFTELDWGADKYLRDGVSLPPDGLPMLRENFDAILLGAMGDPRVPDNRHAHDILLGMRFRLDLYANVRPVKLLDVRLCPLKGVAESDVDFVIIRENTEGAYVGMGGFFKKDTPDEIATQEDVNTRKGVERILRYAYEYAHRRGLRRVCMSDKSNVLTYGHELWQRTFAQVRGEYADVESSHLYVDALAMFLVMEPKRFQVIVTNNMFGDILADVGAALQGGLGMAPSANINPDGICMFEPVHGSAPPLAGKNVANPIGATLSAAMMAEHLKMNDAARLIEASVTESVRTRNCTADIGGSLGTREAAAWLVASLHRARA